MDLEIKVFLVAIVLFPIVSIYYWRRELPLDASLLTAGYGFLFFYLGILLAVFAINTRLNLELQTFDLDGDGFFSGEERTSEQALAMKRVINDTARNFAFITGFIYAIIYSVFLLPSVFIVSYLKNKIWHLSLKNREN